MSANVEDTVFVNLTESQDTRLVNAIDDDQFVTLADGTDVSAELTVQSDVRLL